MCRRCPKRPSDPSQNKDDQEEHKEGGLLSPSSIRYALESVFINPKKVPCIIADFDDHFDELRHLGAAEEDIDEFFEWVTSDEGEVN